MIIFLLFNTALNYRDRCALNIYVRNGVYKHVTYSVYVRNQSLEARAMFARCRFFLFNVNAIIVTRFPYSHQEISWLVVTMLHVQILIIFRRSVRMDSTSESILISFVDFVIYILVIFNGMINSWRRTEVRAYYGMGIYFS